MDPQVRELELGHRGVLQPRWVQKMHRGGVDFEVEGGCAVEFIIMSPPQIHLERCKFQKFCIRGGIFEKIWPIFVVV